MGQRTSHTCCKLSKKRERVIKRGEREETEREKRENVNLSKQPLKFLETQADKNNQRVRVVEWEATGKQGLQLPLAVTADVHAAQCKLIIILNVLKYGLVSSWSFRRSGSRGGSSSSSSSSRRRRRHGQVLNVCHFAFPIPRLQEMAKDEM